MANQLHGYVGADLAAVCREAGLKCIKRSAHLGIGGLSATYSYPFYDILQTRHFLFLFFILFFIRFIPTMR